MQPWLGLALVLLLAGCGVRGAVPADAEFPLLWFVTLSASVFLLSGSLVLLDHLFRAHSRRDDRRDRRDERGPSPKG